MLAEFVFTLFVVEVCIISSLNKYNLLTTYIFRMFINTLLIKKYVCILLLFIITSKLQIELLNYKM